MRTRLLLSVAAVSGSRSDFLEPAQNFVVFRKLPGFVLAVDSLAIDVDIEHAAAAADEFRLDVEFILDSGRQTGGLGQVVSLYAVRNADSHRNLLAA
jgi:hypothetical protein